MSTDKERRATMLRHLDESRPYLETCAPNGIAVELIVQALDAMPRDEWDSIIACAFFELFGVGESLLAAATPAREPAVEAPPDVDVDERRIAPEPAE